MLRLGFLCLIIHWITGSILAQESVKPSSPHEHDEQLWTKVSQIFRHSCVECHNSLDKHGELSLQTFSEFSSGGESGSLLSEEGSSESLLLSMIQPVDGKADMPKDRPGLLESEIESLKTWIEAGAPWPEGVRIDKERTIDRSWWSLQPLRATPAPLDANMQEWYKHPIDAYIAEALAKRGLRPNRQADRATLIRRLYYDLIGLPPTMEEVRRFEADDDPGAYERLVDRLLASPGYGERWARHWLDVVHYGETHGYDKDKPRPNAWPYRDYCIRAFNSDLPYRQFVREQLAADALEERSDGAIEGLGFLSAGPWDFIGHAEVAESKIDGKIARHLDRDDVVQTTMLSFMSMTAGCAQCHDHKFDPVSQAEYYGLQSVFAAIDRTEIEYYFEDLLQRRWETLKGQKRLLELRRKELDDSLIAEAGSELVELRNRIVSQSKQGLKRPEAYGYHSGLETSEDAVKWVMVDLGHEESLSAIEWIACHDDFQQIGAGFGYPKRFRIDLFDDLSAEPLASLNRSDTDFANPGCQPQRWNLVQPVRARWVKFTATKLAVRSNDYNFALAELRAWNVEGDNAALGRTVTSLDSIEAPVRWAASNLVDGSFPEVATEESLAQLRQLEAQLIDEKVDSASAKQWRELIEKIKAIDDAIEAMPPRRKTFAGAVHHGSGAFQGTGANGGRPRPIHVLARGDIRRPTIEVFPGGLECIDHSSEIFAKASELDDGRRREALANWITNDDNPLVWRSIVNRLWHYHFGVGLVDTPNDFGRMGSLPTHPELLDRLAIQLRQDQSIKEIQRLMVTSATYMQDSKVDATSEAIRFAEQVDSQNRFLWRMNRRRLEAEAIRDALLWVSGNLERSMGGPSFQDFVVEQPEHSPHYEYHLHRKDDPKAMKRSIYRMIVRSQTQPFLTTLDCADPSIQVDRRVESNSALQALAMLNDPLVIFAAESMAERNQHRSEEDIEGWISEIFSEATSRIPTDPEIEWLVGFGKRHGLTNAVRAIFNLNEFIYVD